MTRRKSKDEEAAEQDLLRQGKILLDGISPAALELIAQLGHYDEPVFQFRTQKLEPISHDAPTLALMAAVRDGERGLVQTIRWLRDFAEKNSNPQ